MTAQARFTKADVKRAVAGVTAAGLPVHSVEIDPNGKIVVIVQDGGPRRARGWPGLE